MPIKYTFCVIFHMVEGKNNASPRKKIEARAEEILSAGGQIKKMSDERWRVSSQTVSGKSYVVSFGMNGSACECGYSKNRKGARCKHIVAVEMHVMSQKDPAASPARIVLGRVEIRCPNKCGSGRIIKYGLRKHPHREPTQTYKCLGCKRRFSHKPGFENKRHPPSLIIMSIMLVSTGVSPKVISLLFRNCGRGVHPDTITRWSKHYADSVHALAASLKPSFGSKWSADEKFKRIGGKDCWLFTVMDTATRFVLSWDVAASKMSYDATNLLKAARDAAGFKPRIFVTDGLHAYSVAFKKAFLASRGPRPVHIRDCHWLKKFCSNNGHERLNRELADILDGIKVIRDPESHLFKLIILHHNFIRPHMGLGGKTPAAAAGITIEGPQWMTLIENAALLKRDKEPSKENPDCLAAPAENAALRKVVMVA